MSSRKWGTRAVDPDRAARYIADGWWTDETLGQMVENGLGRAREVPFRVRSKVRPYDGTLGDVDIAARRLAGAMTANGIGAGDVVMFQLPNWVEAGITFWAAAYVGAVVVPVVHFYGAKEIDYILRVAQPDLIVTADAFGLSDYLATYDGLLAADSTTPWLVVGDTPAASLPARATAFDTWLDAAPIAGPVDVDPDSPAIVAFTSGTTSNPKGVVHSHRTIGCETRQLNRMFPMDGPPLITGSPVGHFIGMVNAFLVPLLRDYPVTLVDVWDPTAVLRLMVDENLGVGGGATFFLMSLLDHPDFTDAHLKLMPYAGLGGSTVPVAVTERATRMGIVTWRSYGSTEHPSISGSYIEDPEIKRLTTDGHAMDGVEIRLGEDGEIFSRGPDLCIGYTDGALTDAMFDADGWYRTGDVGVLDADGYLAITDRVSDIIIRGGENISAQEVEELLLGLPGVAEVGVVAAPDERLGERVAAVMRVLPDATAPTLDEVRVHMAAAGLARQKWPESIYTVADFPRTPSGKIQKFRLRQMLRDGDL